MQGLLYDEKLADAIENALSTGPRSHMELAEATGASVVTINSIVTENPDRFVKFRVPTRGRLRQRETLIYRIRGYH